MRKNNKVSLLAYYCDTVLPMMQVHESTVTMGSLKNLLAPSVICNNVTLTLTLNDACRVGAQLGE